MLYAVLISVVHVECVAHSINQASFKPAGLVTGDPITGEKSHSRHSHSVSPTLMHCGNLLTIQFQTQTPMVYTVPQLLPSRHLFPFIRPHTSIKKRMKESCSYISRQKCASKEQESGGESKDWVETERESVMREKEEPKASLSISMKKETRHVGVCLNWMDKPNSINCTVIFKVY